MTLRAGGLLLGWLVAPRDALAADPDLALRRVDLDPPDAGTSHLYFGEGAAGGDFDGDGFSDLAVGEFGAATVYVYAGSPSGVATAPWQVLAPRDDGQLGGYGEFGAAITAIDADGDVFMDLAVSSVVPAVYLYRGGPAGLSENSSTVFEELNGGYNGPIYYGHKLGDAGDTDGDGFHELVISDPAWSGEELDGGPYHVGAIFVYSGTSDGPDPCSESDPLVVRSDESEEWNTSLGWSLAAGADYNGDGYADLASLLLVSTDVDGYSGSVAWWSGGSAGIGVAPVGTLDGCCDVSAAGDVDGDGYDDLALWSFGNDDVGRILFGSPSGPDPDVTVRVPYELTWMTGVGDADGDGADDLLAGHRYGETDTWVALVFGDANRPEDLTMTRLETESTVWEDWAGWGTLFAAGDLNADGHADFASAAAYTGYYEGRLSVYSPVCTWYADQDGDGHGDPSVTLDTCHDPGPGWSATPDDCDDTDATVFGDTWYLDVDGDGYGTRAGATLACTQPAGTSTSWQDCDDADPGIYPGADDLDADGIDQDCDAHDGPWVQDTGACPEPAQDTGQPATPGDTGDSPVLDDTASDSPDADPRSASSPGCGCAGAAGVPLASFSTLPALLLARRRRG